MTKFTHQNMIKAMNEDVTNIQDFPEEMITADMYLHYLYVALPYMFDAACIPINEEEFDKTQDHIKFMWDSLRNV